MATTVTSAVGKFDAFTRDQAPTYNVLAKAFLGVGSLAERVTAQAQVANAPDFIVTAKTTASETGTVLDLTAAGITFPAGTHRLIEADVFIAGDNANEGSWARLIQHVVGGTTPILRVTSVSFTVGASGATFPPVVAGNVLFSTSAGIAAGAGAILALSGNSVLLQVVSAEAEVVNFVVRVKIGKLQPMSLGV